LIELSKKYFHELGNSILEINTAVIKKEVQEADIYQCPDCLTLYHSNYGDPSQNIEKGTLFQDLPQEYCCALCESPKSKFRKLVEKVSL
jgi:rubredoxin